MMGEFLSQKIKFYSFMAMFFLVYVHGYNLNETYLYSSSLVREPMTFTTFFEYFFSNGLLRFRIPLLFIISGYLYAFNDYKPYQQRTLKRLRTLGIPYLIWGFFALLLTYLLEFNPLMREAIKSSYQTRMSETIIFVQDYHFEHWLMRMIVPLAFQLWFIRVLLVYSIAYPLLRWFVIKTPKIWFLISFFFWFVGLNLFFIESEGLLFFSLGIWLQKTNFDIEKSPKYLNPTILMIIFVSSCFIKTYLAFQGYNFLNGFNTVLMFFLYKITEITGFIGIWYGGNSVVRWANKQKILQKIMSFSFMIYAFHVPILYFVMLAVNHYLRNWQYHRFFTYLFIPIFIVMVSILTGFLLRKFTPKVYHILTGGRGII